MSGPNFCPSCGAKLSGGDHCWKCSKPVAVGDSVQPIEPGVTPPKKTRPAFLVVGGVTIGVLALAFFSSPPTPVANPQGRVAEDKALRRASPKAVLELTAFSWHTEHGYAIVEGMVKNISPEPLESVQAVAIFSDNDGNFITSADALIDYRPILPGQSSPFKVMKSENPAMKSARVEFKQFAGGELKTLHNWKR